MSDPKPIREVLLTKLHKDLDRAMAKVQKIKEHVAIIERALPPK